MLLNKIVVQHVNNFLEPWKQKLCSKMRKNRPQLMVAGPLIFHNNACQHIANVVTTKLRDYGWGVLPHESYISDMSQTELDLFPKLKEPIRGRHFSFSGSRLRWARGYRTRHWIRDSRVQTRSGSMNFFSENKNPEYDFLRKESKAVDPVS